MAVGGRYGSAFDGASTTTERVISKGSTRRTVDAVVRPSISQWNPVTASKSRAASCCRQVELAEVGPAPASYARGKLAEVYVRRRHLFQFAGSPNRTCLCNRRVLASFVREPGAGSHSLLTRQHSAKIGRTVKSRSYRSSIREAGHSVSGRDCVTLIDVLAFAQRI
jgi:hypothetical protein